MIHTVRGVGYTIDSRNGDWDIADAVLVTEHGRTVRESDGRVTFPTHRAPLFGAILSGDKHITYEKD